MLLSDDKHLPSPDMLKKVYGALFTLVSVFLLIAVLAILVCSLSWEGQWDAMWIHRITYLIFKKGYVPYRDIFDGNMYGIYWIHGLVGAIGGYNDLGLRILDILWLTTQCSCIWLIVRRIDRHAGFLAALAYAWLYLNQNENQLLQREHLMMLPIGCSLCIALESNRFLKRPWLRPILIGAFYGLGFSIIPYCAISLPLIALYDQQISEVQGFSLQTFKLNSFRKSVEALSLASAGFGAVLLLGFVWLYWMGGLHDFITITTQYWPMHGDLSIHDKVFVPSALCPSLWDSFMHLQKFPEFEKRKYLIPCAVLAFIFIARNRSIPKEKKGICTLLLGCFLLHLLCLVLIKAYHPYSWMPPLFFLVQLFSIGMACPFFPGAPWIRAVITAFAIVAFSYCATDLNQSFRIQITGRPFTTIYSMQSNSMLKFLKENLNEGDKVQPMDFLGGCDRALTLAGADNGTFITNEHYLYFHVKNPLVQGLRTRFMDEFRHNRPRFVIFVTENRLWTQDPEDDGTFRKEFVTWIEANYTLRSKTDSYIIFEINKANNIP